MIDHMDWHDLALVEPEGRAQVEWVHSVAQVADKAMYKHANSWYLGANFPGGLRVFMPHMAGFNGYAERYKAIRADGYAGVSVSGVTRDSDQSVGQQMARRMRTDVSKGVD